VGADPTGDRSAKGRRPFKKGEKECTSVTRVNNGSAKLSVLKQALRSCRGAFYATAVFSFFINLLMFVQPLYMLQVYDRVLVSRSEQTLVLLTVIAGGMLLLMALLELVRSRVLVRVGAHLDRQLSLRVFRAVFDPANRKAGVGPQALSDLNTVREFLTGAGFISFCDAPWTPIFLVIAFAIHPWLGVLSLVAMIILVILAVLNEISTRETLQDAGKMSGAASQYAQNSMRSAEALQAMGMMPGIAARWSRQHGRMLELQALASDRAGLIVGLSKFTRIFVQVMVLGLGAYLAIENLITAGMIIACSIILGRALQPVEMVIGQWKFLLNARAAYGRLNDALSAVPQDHTNMALPRPEGRLVVERVIAMQPGTQVAILKGVTFALEPGEVLGVIGPSAAGKSTLARALIGIWPIMGGAVRLDGVDIHQWSREEVGPHLGYLPQDVALFDGTIAENIARFGAVDSLAVIEAAQKAGVHDMVLGFPAGYDTVIGDGGHVLSGGQRQRIGLARALYGRPAFVLLDEPNSNLDSVGEEALMRAIHQMRQEKTTVVVISHRMNILTGVDKIMLLTDGQVAQFGPRDQIIGQLTRPVPMQQQQQPAPRPPTPPTGTVTPLQTPQPGAVAPGTPPGGPSPTPPPPSDPSLGTQVGTEGQERKST
jgi:PrtD family type I secretion system ABC transporter